MIGLVEVVLFSGIRNQVVEMVLGVDVIVNVFLFLGAAGNDGLMERPITDGVFGEDLGTQSLGIAKQ